MVAIKTINTMCKTIRKKTLKDFKRRMKIEQKFPILLWEVESHQTCLEMLKEFPEERDHCEEDKHCRYLIRILDEGFIDNDDGTFYSELIKAVEIKKGLNMWLELYRPDVLFEQLDNGLVKYIPYYLGVGIKLTYDWDLPNIELLSTRIIPFSFVTVAHEHSLTEMLELTMADIIIHEHGVNLSDEQKNGSDGIMDDYLTKLRMMSREQKTPLYLEGYYEYGNGQFLDRYQMIRDDIAN
jgi:hypothetical protein